jgi:prepilin-type N-terminal cleavage/methylation domain-containing protein
MSRIVNRLRREESGFTLIELVVAMSIGSLVILAAFSILDSSVVLTGKVTDRVDRTQRARVAMEDITRKLRSQVCPAPGQGAIIDAQDYSVKFYMFSGTKPFVPEIRQIAWDTNTNSIIDTRWVGSGTAPATTWNAAPTTRTLITDVAPPPLNVPMFAYYATGATSAFGSPLSATNRNATSRITIAFRTFGTGKGVVIGKSTTVTGEAFARTADPDGSSGSTAPECA